MLRLLAIYVLLAVECRAEETLPVLPRVYQNDSALGLILGHDLTEVGFVAAHCEAVDRYFQQILFLPALPPPRARIEILDPQDEASISVRNFSGEVFVQVQLGKGMDPSKLATEVAVRTWLGRVALAGGKPLDISPLWLQRALMGEARVLLRPALLDLWYREGRAKSPDTLENILAGRATDGESFIFLRTLRAESGSSALQGKMLIAVAQGADLNQCLPKEKPLTEASWQMSRANLLLTRNPVSLGMRESAEALDDMARFVFDLGQGDLILTGPQAVENRERVGIQKGMAARLASLRLEILRQNPVYHNAWRAFGAWLENFPQAKPEALNQLWEDFLRERLAAEALRREVEAALSHPSTP